MGNITLVMLGMKLPKLAGWEARLWTLSPCFRIPVADDHRNEKGTGKRPCCEDGMSRVVCVRPIDPLAFWGNP